MTPSHPHPATGFQSAIADDLSDAIDAAAAVAPESHRFLRRGWFAAAVAAYRHQAVRTLVVRDGEAPILAIPLVALGPPWLGAAQLPGSYWPFRSFPAAATLPAAAADAAVATLARGVTALRIGPVGDDDPAAAALLAAARRAGWAVLDRRLGTGWLLDLAARQREGWPRGSTLRKNRFHEKHLAAHGELGWRILGPGDWPAAFDAMAAVEEKSWIATATDGRDAKFTARGHGAFWRAVAADPALATMLRGALLSVDGVPAAFSFDLDTGARMYAIANSYDPAIARHSPGKLLAYRNLAAAAARGVTLVDWGMGDTSYKRVMGAAEGPVLRDWLLLRPGLPASLGRTVAQWRIAGRLTAQPSP